MLKTHDNPAAAPPPAGHYTQVIRIDAADTRTLYLSGQVAVDADGEVIAPGDMTRQSEVVMDLIGTLLSAHGAGYDDIVSIRSFVTDMDRLSQYGAVRARYFRGAPPTSTTVEVSRLFKPGALLEVEAVAVLAG